MLTVDKMLPYRIVEILGAAIRSGITWIHCRFGRGDTNFAVIIRTRRPMTRFVPDAK